jgi:hypothetical protein
MDQKLNRKLEKRSKEEIHRAENQLTMRQDDTQIYWHQ